MTCLIEKIRNGEKKMTKIIIPYIEKFEDADEDVLRVEEIEVESLETFFKEDQYEQICFGGTKTYNDLLKSNPICIAYYDVGRREGRLRNLIEGN